MGKKKSVVLMTLITIVIVVLSFITAFPAFTIPGTNGVKKWNPAVLQFDLGTDFSGGYYAYYYPQGVITEKEYNDNVAALEGDEKTEYEESYKKHGDTSLYLSTDPDDGIYTQENKETVTVGFQTAFAQAVELISDRFEARAAKTGSDFRVSVVDDYAIRVQLSAVETTKELSSSEYVSQAFSLFSLTDKLYFMQDDEVVDELVDEDTDIKDLIKSVSVKTQYEVAQIKIAFTSKGKEMLESFKSTAATDTSATLDLTIGKGTDKTTLLQITSDVINTKNEVFYGVRYEEEKLYADTLCVLINTAMEKGGICMNDNETTPFAFNTLAGNAIRVYEPAYGDTFVWVLVGVLAVIVAAAVIAIVKMGGFGVMNLYTTVSYFLITALCFAFISGGVFPVTAGSILIFLVGLALTNVLNAYIYKAIAKEVSLGKTVSSSVKAGYNKTLLNIVDVYAVLLLGAIALLIGVAGMSAIAAQAIICVVAGAFCNLLWGRVINLMLLSASKDKYKYFRFVREDDDDE